MSELGQAVGGKYRLVGFHQPGGDPLHLGLCRRHAQKRHFTMRNDRGVLRPDQ